MSRLIRLLSVSTAIHQFDRFRGLRSTPSCRENKPAQASGHLAMEIPRFGLAAMMPVKRAAAVRPTLRPVTSGTTVHSRPAPVRIYQGRSGITMVGKIDAICRMIDTAIADEGAHRHSVLADGI